MMELGNQMGKRIAYVPIDAFRFPDTISQMLPFSGSFSHYLNSELDETFTSNSR
jgi:hypothetical protein